MKVVCEKCGAIQDKQKVFCIDCGEILNNNKYIEDETEDKIDKFLYRTDRLKPNFIEIIIGVLSVAAILTIVIISISYKKLYSTGNIIIMIIVFLLIAFEALLPKLSWEIGKVMSEINTEGRYWSRRRVEIDYEYGPTDTFLKGRKIILYSLFVLSLIILIIYIKDTMANNVSKEIYNNGYNHFIPTKGTL